MSDKGDARSKTRRLPLRAGAYWWVVVVAAGTVVAISVTHVVAGNAGLLEPGDWATFVVLGAALAAAQMFVVVTPANQSYHTTAVFLIPAVLLLPPELVALMPIVQHVPDWIRRRLPFHIQAFNVANYTLAAMAAWVAAHEVAGVPGTFVGAGAQAATAGAAAAVVFVGVNHVLLAPMLKLARGHSLRETGLFSYASLSTDLAVAALGVGFASLWAVSPWLAPFALAPLVLIQRSLGVPALEAEARVDPKTGLFNARHFAATLDDELDRAKRFGRPVSVLMADLDLLRDINNTYGHLAGDAVLVGIADVFRRELREYDVPTRFGGEEFAIVLPETEAREAVRIAERIRRAVAASAFEVRTTNDAIRATLSIGVAAFPRDGYDANDLVHQADVASYRAKLRGRNRVVDAAERGPDAHGGAEHVPRVVALAPRLRAVADTHDIARLRRDSTAAMASLSARVDARDDLTVGHSQRVREVALAIGGELRLDDDQLDALGHAALFHDIGKLTVPDRVLLKGEELTDDDWAEMRRHAEEGAAIIGRFGFLADSVPAIRHHHERYDGAGYPDRLAREQIPLGARILHVAEAFDAMRTATARRPARALDAVVEELVSEAGRQFCPRCVDALVAVVKRNDGSIPVASPTLVAVS